MDHDILDIETFPKMEFLKTCYYIWMFFMNCFHFILSNTLLNSIIHSVRLLLIFFVSLYSPGPSVANSRWTQKRRVRKLQRLKRSRSEKVSKTAKRL